MQDLKIGIGEVIVKNLVYIIEHELPKNKTEYLAYIDTAVSHLMEIIQTTNPRTYYASDAIAKAIDWQKWVDGEMDKKELAEKFNIFISQ